MADKFPLFKIKSKGLSGGPVAKTHVPNAGAQGLIHSQGTAAHNVAAKMQVSQDLLAGASKKIPQHWTNVAHK